VKTVNQEARNAAIAAIGSLIRDADDENAVLNAIVKAREALDWRYPDAAPAELWEALWLMPTRSDEHNYYKYDRAIKKLVAALRASVPETDKDAMDGVGIIELMWRAILHSSEIASTRLLLDFAFAKA
jgi:hypothetical protein